MSWWHQDVRMNRRTTCGGLKYERLVESLFYSYIILRFLPTLHTQVTASPKLREGESRECLNQETQPVRDKDTTLKQEDDMGSYPLSASKDWQLSLSPPQESSLGILQRCRQDGYRHQGFLNNIAQSVFMVKFVVNQPSAHLELPIRLVLHHFYV